jgi:hypothetical protein
LTPASRITNGRLPQRRAQRARIGEAVAPGALAQLAEQVRARGDAHVRADQCRFQLFVERIVERARRPQQPGEAVAEVAARLGEPVAQAREPAATVRGGSFRT